MTVKAPLVSGVNTGMSGRLSSVAVVEATILQEGNLDNKPGQQWHLKVAASSHDQLCYRLVTYIREHIIDAAPIRDNKVGWRYQRVWRLYDNL